MTRIFSILAITFLIFTSACVTDEARSTMQKQFSDQHFKTAIALIELHKVREGEYPAELDSLKYLGKWDQIIFTSVTYQRLPNGYQLDVKEGPGGGPEGLSYPEDFWKGLGLVRSNVKE